VKHRNIAVSNQFMFVPNAVNFIQVKGMLPLKVWIQGGRLFSNVISNFYTFLLSVVVR
jgi:hypothetical protein